MDFCLFFLAQIQEPWVNVWILFDLHNSTSATIIGFLETTTTMDLRGPILKTSSLNSRSTQIVVFTFKSRIHNRCAKSLCNIFQTYLGPDRRELLTKYYYYYCVARVV